MRKLLLVILLVLMGGLAGIVSAATPVYDPLAWIQRSLAAAERVMIRINTQINNHTAILRLRNQIKQLQRMERQWKQIERQYQTLSGKHGFGRWLKGPANLLDPRFRPKTKREWAETFASGGTYKPYEKSTPFTPTNVSARAKNDLSISTKKTAKTSQLINDDIANTRERMAVLIEDMDNAEEVDEHLAVQNTLLLELHMNITKLLQLMSAQVEMQAAAHAETVNRANADAKFNRY